MSSMIKRLALLVLCFSLSSTSLRADETLDDWFDYLAGSWDWQQPGGGTGSVDWQPGVVPHTLQGTGSVGTDYRQQWLWGWDPVAERIVNRNYDSLGATAIARYRVVSDSELQGRLVIREMSGATVVCRAALTRVNADQFQLELNDWRLKSDGSTPADRQDVRILVQRRRPAMQLSEEVTKLLDYYVGDWTYTWQVDGHTYDGRWSVRWSPDRSCLISDWENTGPKEPRCGTIVTGWDHATHQMLQVDFNPSGEHVITRYDCPTFVDEQGLAKGFSGTGEPISYRAVTTKSLNSFTWKLSERREGDETLPDLNFQFKRVTPRPAKSTDGADAETQGKR